MSDSCGLNRQVRQIMRLFTFESIYCFNPLLDTDRALFVSYQNVHLNIFLVYLVHDHHDVQRSRYEHYGYNLDHLHALYFHTMKES